jgi:NADP-dependent 3-hydroxy acid dehydrogenase YdfG
MSTRQVVKGPGNEEMQTRKSKVVVITGASAGVGRATAREFAKSGARIGLLARDLDRLETTRQEVEALGGDGLAISVDVADAQGVEAAAQQIEAAFGPIDVWINNAMSSVFSTVSELKPDEVKRVTDVTYLGAVHGTLAALRRMKSRGCGTIVQVGSALAFRSIPLQAAYCAAKHALEGFTASLQTELLHEKSRVKVTSVHLPALNTPQFSWVKSRLPRKPQPVPPLYQPEVAARAIVWAARHPRRQVLVGSPTVAAVYGQRLAPAALDRYLACTGYDAQQAHQAEDPRRPDNLWEAVPGEYGAHGTFDAKAREFSVQFWLTSHRALLLAGAVAVAGAMLARLQRKSIADERIERRTHVRMQRAA